MAFPQPPGDPYGPYGRPPGPYVPGNPYAAPGFYGPPPRRSRKVWIGVAIVGALLVIGVVALGVFGLTLVDEEASRMLEQHPQVEKALGSAPDCKMDWASSMKDERYDYFHYVCTGSKGKGRAVIHTEPDGPEQKESLVDGTLSVEGGATITLAPAN